MTYLIKIRKGKDPKSYYLSSIGKSINITSKKNDAIDFISTSKALETLEKATKLLSKRSAYFQPMELFIVDYDIERVIYLIHLNPLKSLQATERAIDKLTSSNDFTVHKTSEYDFEVKRIVEVMDVLESHIKDTEKHIKRAKAMLKTLKSKTVY